MPQLRVIGLITGCLHKKEHLYQYRMNTINTISPTGDASNAHAYHVRTSDHLSHPGKMNTSKNIPFRQLRIASILAGLILSLASQASQADEQDTFNIYFSESFAHDDNLFRLSDGVDPATLGLGKSKRSENIRTDSLWITADKKYSLQRFHVGARYDNYNFSNYSFLDYNTRNMDGRWDWALTPHITGQLIAERVQAFNNFADFQTYIRSIRTTDAFRGNAELGSLGALRFVVGANQSKTTNSEAIQEDNDSRSRSAHGGLRYLTSSGNSVGYLYRRYRIEWINRGLDAVNLYDTEAGQTDHEINAKWNFAGQAALEGAIARIKRTHDHFEERDFTGTNARLSLNWVPDAQWRVGASAKRDYNSWWSSSASYTTTDSISVTPTWLIAEKISLYGRADWSQRKFREPLIATTANGRLDKVSTYQIGLNWTPVRYLTLGTDVQSSRRNSNQPGLDFSDTTVSARAQANF